MVRCAPCGVSSETETAEFARSLRLAHEVAGCEAAAVVTVGPCYACGRRTEGRVWSLPARCDCPCHGPGEECEGVKSRPRPMGGSDR